MISAMRRSVLAPRRKALRLVVFSLISVGNLFPQKQPIPSEPTGSVTGRLIDPRNGQAVAGANVDVKISSWSQAPAVRSRADGSFKVPIVKAGTYSLAVSALGFAVEFVKGDWGPTEEFEVEPNKATDLGVIRLTPQAVISGKVLDPFGEPVRNAGVRISRRVRIQPDSQAILADQYVSTDDRGVFEIRAAPGRYLLDAEVRQKFHRAIIAPDGSVQWQLGEYPRIYLGGEEDGLRAREIEIAAGQRMMDLTIGLVWREQISAAPSIVAGRSFLKLRIVDAGTKNAVPRAEVSVSHELADESRQLLGDQTVTALSDDEGFVVLPGVSEGFFRIRVKRTGYAPTYYRDDSAADPWLFPSSPTLSEAHEVQISSAASIAGRVLIGPETPWMGRVTLLQRVVSRHGDSKWSGSSNVYSDLDGRYRFDGLRPGNYTLKAVVPENQANPLSSGTPPPDQFNIGVLETYLGNVTREADAAVVTLKSGVAIDSADIRVTFPR